MAPLKKFAIKLYVFSAILLYMAGDLYVWHGPLAQKFEHHFAIGKKPANDTSPVRTTVYGEGITQNQIDRRTREIALASGYRDPATAPQRPGTVKLSLIDEALLRLRARANDTRLPDTSQAAEQSVAGLASKYETPEAFEAFLKTQGYTRDSLTNKIAAILKEEATARRSIEEVIVPTDKEIARYYGDIKEQLAIPASRSVRHIFLATLNRNPADIENKAKDILAQLTAQADPAVRMQQFEELARTRSEDERTAPTGGNLGNIYDNGRRPFPDLALFDIDTLPADTPTLMQSKLGWHIVLASGIAPGGIPPLADVKESIRTALHSWQRQYASSLYREELRKEAFSTKKIHHHDQ